MILNLAGQEGAAEEVFEDIDDPMQEFENRKRLRIFAGDA